MASIPHTFIQSGRYYFRRRARLTKSFHCRASIALGTREPALARHCAGALSTRFTELVRRVAMFIERGDSLSQQMIDELFDRELRKCLDDLLLGYHAAADPWLVADSYRTAAAAFRLAQRPAATREINGAQRDRLLSQGFNDISVENVAADLDRYAHPGNISDALVEEWIAAFGMMPSRASYQAIAAHITRAHGRAHELASRFLDPEIQDAVDPAAALFGRARDEAFRADGLSPLMTQPAAGVSTPTPTPIPPRRTSQFFLTYSSLRFSEIIDEVADSLKADKRWTGDITQQKRIMRAFAWITGDKALGDYNHLDVAAFKTALQLLPRDFKFHEHVDKPYEAAKAKIVKLKETYEQAEDKSKVAPYVRRQATTINRDLSFMSSVAEELAKTHWAPVIPNTKVLDFTGSLVKKAKASGTTPVRPSWRVSQLQQLFHAPVWTGGGGHLRRLHPAPPEDVWHDAGYWLPLLLYYSHASLNEMAGLKLEEVSLDTPVSFVTVRNNNLRGTDDELRGEKRSARGRDVPLHKEILRLGFRDYVAAIAAEGHTALFPELYLGDAMPVELAPLLPAHGSRPKACEKRSAEQSEIDGVRHRPSCKFSVTEPFPSRLPNRPGTGTSKALGSRAAKLMPLF